MHYFDLNIDHVLDNWEVHHAIREILANALDEQILSETKSIEIKQISSDTYLIRDYGRGLQVSDLRQNENEEKKRHPHVMGYFGVGLKDALAVFERDGVDVRIESKHARFRLERHAKHGFEGIETLHVKVEESPNPHMKGTAVYLQGVKEKDMHRAQDFFLHFKDLRVLEETIYGEILALEEGRSHIFINGQKVSEEDNFLFSYNITSLTKAIEKALNRERNNLNRSVYADRIRSILTKSKSEAVLEKMLENINNENRHEMKDELGWLDVGIHVVKHFNQQGNHLFISQYEAMALDEGFYEVLRTSGKELIVLSDRLYAKVKRESRLETYFIHTVDHFLRDYEEGFTYQFLSEDALSKKEKAILSLKANVFAYFPETEISIAEKMRPEFTGETYEYEYLESEDRIILSQASLKSETSFYAALFGALIDQHFAAEVQKQALLELIAQLLHDKKDRA